MNWRIKGLVQKSLSIIPGGTVINDALQVSLGGLRDFASNVDDKVVNDWAVLVSHTREIGHSVAGQEYVEVGTGWFPTLPVCYSLAGVRSCKTFDIVRHLDEKLTFRMLGCLHKHLELISDASGRSMADVVSDHEKLLQCRSVPQLLDAARIEYIAPGDAAHSGLPDCSVDVMYSNSVLEHVPEEMISKIMAESRRILRPGGLSIHSANCGDHYAYFDSNISFINYLQYSEQNWKLWNNSLLYQNRLRPQDFAEIVEQAGLKVILYKYKPKPQLLQRLTNMAIAPEFQKYPPEQLASTSVDIVGQRSAD
jgi:SAM-dependent methyltransferase